MDNGWSRLLIAAVHHLPVFEELNKRQLSIQELQHKLNLKERPAMVLFPALCAMQVLAFNTESKLYLTELGNYLVATHQPNLIGYVELEKDDAGVLEMVQRLRNDGPVNIDMGVSYVKEGETPSPMDDPDTSPFFTLALAGRARYLSPIVAEKLPKREAHLVDVAGGTGFYIYEWLLANPTSTATLFGRRKY